MENEVGKYLSSFYQGLLSLHQMVGMMQSMSSSPKDSQNYQIFEGILKVLTEECKFYSKYPAEELRLTSELLGALLNNNLFLYNMDYLSIVLDFILDGLRQNSSTKLYQFGYIALNNFQKSLSLYPSFAIRFSTLPTNDPNLERIQRGCIEFVRSLPEGTRNLTYLAPLPHLPFLPHAPHAPNLPKNLFKDLPKGGAGDSDIINSADSADSAGSNNCASAADPLESCGESGNPIQLINQIIKWEGRGENRANLEFFGASKTKCGESFGAGEMERLMDKIAEHPFITPPSAQVAEKVFAAFNNICLANVAMKSSELAPLIETQHLNWLSLYIVKCRASKEPNLQDVFVRFLELLNIPKIFEFILTITYACVNVCLQYMEELKLLTSYRTLLKNLGLWLGKVTLARNVPIMSRHVDLKALTIDSYEKGCLSSILPFTIKTLEGVKDSKIFKPPNPWTSALLSLLVEIYDLPNLKTNLVFEITLLMNSLGVDIQGEKAKIRASGKRRALEGRVRPRDSPDFTLSGQTGQSVPPPGAPAGGGQPNVSGIGQPNASGTGLTAEGVATLIGQVTNKGFFTPTGLAVGETKSPFDEPALEYGGYEDKLLKQIPKLLLISPTIALFDIQPHLKSIIPLAIDRAVRKILPGIQRHCISVAKVTAINLIAKDFVHRAHPGSPSYADGEENGKAVNLDLVRRATCLAMASLAGSLSLATCKEPLRLACHESLRLALQQHRTKDSNDQILIEQIVQVITNDNLITISRLVEKAVVERSMRLVDDIFSKPAAEFKQQQQQLPLEFQQVPAGAPIRLPQYLLLANPPTLTQLDIYRKIAPPNTTGPNVTGSSEFYAQQAPPEQPPSLYAPGGGQRSEGEADNFGHILLLGSINGPLDRLAFDDELIAHLLLLYYKTERSVMGASINSHSSLLASLHKGPLVCNFRGGERLSNDPNSPTIADVMKIMIEKLPRSFIASISASTGAQSPASGAEEGFDADAAVAKLLCAFNRSFWGFRPDTPFCGPSASAPDARGGAGLCEPGNDAFAPLAQGQPLPLPLPLPRGGEAGPESPAAQVDVNQIAANQQLFQRIIRRWTALCRDPMINTQGTRLGYVWSKFDEKMGISAVMGRLGKFEFYKNLLPLVPEGDFDCMVKLVQGVDLVEKMKAPSNLSCLVDALTDHALSEHHLRAHKPGASGDLEGNEQRTYKLFLQLIDGYLATPTSACLAATAYIAQALLRLFSIAPRIALGGDRGPLASDAPATNPVPFNGWYKIVCHAHLTTKLLSMPTYWPLLFQLLKRIIVHDVLFGDLAAGDHNSQVAMILCDISIGCPEFIVKYHLALLAHLPQTRRDLWNLVNAAAPRNSVIPDPRACDEVELLPGSAVDVDRPVFSTLLLHGPLIKAIELFVNRVPPTAMTYDMQEFDLLVTIRDSFYREMRNLHLKFKPNLCPQGSSAADFSEDQLDYALTLQLIFSLLSFIYQLQVAQGPRQPAQEQAKYLSQLSQRAGAHHQIMKRCSDGSFNIQLNSLVLFLLMSTEGNVRRWIIRALTAFLRFPNRQTIHFSRLYQWLILEAKDGELGFELVFEIYAALSSCKPHTWGVALVFLEILKMDVRSMAGVADKREFLDNLFHLARRMFGKDVLCTGHNGVADNEDENKTNRAADAATWN